MSERVCEGCRFYAPAGACWRYPTAIETLPNATCGEWRDKTVTPEQEERRELVRRFAVALAGTEWASDHTWPKMWEMASSMADAEPGNSGREI